MKQTIRIPQAIHSTFDGFVALLSIAKHYIDSRKDDAIILDFQANTWFDANLLPVIFAIIEFGRLKGVTSSYLNQQDCKLHKLLIRNGFAKYCFNLAHQPLQQETVIPFKIFRASDTYGFSAYMDAELLRYFPNMDIGIKRAISTYIQELFGNAQIHGLCSHVYTCGQYYFQNHKMDFTIVNLGKTIGENVVEFLCESNIELPISSIAWAVEPNHSTKRNHSGGIGLTLMRDFIQFNRGKFQIVSGNEFWELHGNMKHSRNFEISFPGTIINIEIDQDDKNFYRDIRESLFESIF